MAIHGSDDEFEHSTFKNETRSSVQLKRGHPIRIKVAQNIVDGMRGITLTEGDKKPGNRNDTVKKQASKKKAEEREATNGTVLHPVIRTRTSPRVLYECIKKLNEEQRSVVTKMGLESVLGLGTKGISTRLGYYVVDRLDPIDMKLMVCNSNIDITVESIHAILGLPMVGFDILRDEQPAKELDIASVFKQQFPLKPKMRLTEVMDLIKNTKDYGLQFKINFLVLFVNVMAGCRTQGCCKIDFLDKICNEHMMSNINWCQYIHDSLRDSKDGWSNTSETCFFAGPITYLVLLYVSSTICMDVTVDRKALPLHAWSFALLKKREDAECDGKGLGNVSLSNVSNETLTKVDTSKSDDGFQVHLKNGNDEWSIHEEKVDACAVLENGQIKVEASTADVRDEDNNDFTSQKKTDIQLMDMSIDRIVAMRIETEERLGYFIEKYRNDIEFVKYTHVLEDIFRYPIASTWCPRSEFGETSKREDGVHGDDAVNELMNVIDFDGAPSDVVNEQPDCMENEGGLQITPTPLSQFWFSPTLHKACEETEKKAIGNKKAKMIDAENTIDTTVIEDTGVHKVVPNSAMKATREEKGKEICIESPVRKGRKGGVLDHTTNNACNVRGPRRTIKLGDHLRSPYYRRAVDMKVTAEEKRYHEWAQAAVGENTEFVFSMWNGKKLNRMDLASLARQTDVARNVIDVWAEILNAEEQHRNRDSPRRFFYSTGVMIDEELSNPFIDFKKQYDIFRRNLAIGSNYDMELMQFKKTDLIFFPILDHTEYYLVMMSLRNGQMVIIDQRSWTDCGLDDVMDAYKPIADTLRCCLVKHLETVKHPVSVSLSEKTHEVLDMHWRTMALPVESGVFFNASHGDLDG